MWGAVAAIVILTVAGVAGLVLFGIAQWQQSNTNDRFDKQDARIEVETETFLRGICEAIVTNRADARALMQRGDLESGAVLVEVFSQRGRPLTPAQQELVRRYQDKLSERQAAIVAEHEADDPDCAAEAAVRRKEREKHR
jgi:hypothetical protein